jgi:FKBP-type peptidyl-prolyl cis-trans isomerase FklB
VIGGWTEALQLMPAGSKWALTIPNNLAYGDEAKGAHIYRGAVLCFELELIEVK